MLKEVHAKAWRVNMMSIGHWFTEQTDEWLSTSPHDVLHFLSQTLGSHKVSLPLSANPVTHWWALWARFFSLSFCISGPLWEPEAPPSKIHKGQTEEPKTGPIQNVRPSKACCPPSPKSQLSANFEFLLLNTAPCAPVSSDLAPSLFASTLSGISQTALHPSPCITRTHRSRVSHFYHPPTLSEMHSERNSSLAKERHLRWQHINVNMLHCSVWISVQHAQHIDKTSSGL